MNTLYQPNDIHWSTRLTGAQPHELKAAAFAFIYFFCILASYYVVRPIRDEMGVQIGKDGIATVFTIVWATMLAVAPVFGWLMSKFPRKKLVIWINVFFALNLVGFFLYFSAAGQQTPIVARVFYVWVSVFNLFVISIFWSLMADVFSTDQAKRLYGFIAAGGTIGAIAGPTLTLNLVGVLGPKNLLLVSAALLIFPIASILGLLKWEKSNVVTESERQANEAEDRPMGGSIWAGLRDVVTNPYLLGICIFLFLFALLSSLLYFAQIEMLPKAIPNSIERTQLLAKVDLAVNILTLSIQFFAFGHLVRKLGNRFMLVSIPVISVVGFVAMAFSPVLAVLMVFGVLRRAGEYAISKPARETLFNVLPAEQKYKAKNVIDTLIHRTGDVSSTWAITGLRKSGFSLEILYWIAVPFAITWTGIAWWLAGQANQRQQNEPLKGNT